MLVAKGVMTLAPPVHTHTSSPEDFALRVPCAYALAAISVGIM